MEQRCTECRRLLFDNYGLYCIKCSPPVIPDGMYLTFFNELQHLTCIAISEDVPDHVMTVVNSLDDNFSYMIPVPIKIFKNYKYLGKDVQAARILYGNKLRGQDEKCPVVIAHNESKRQSGAD